MITEEAKRAALTDIQNISVNELIQVLEAVGCTRKLPTSESMEYVDFSNMNEKIFDNNALAIMFPYMRT
jgi:hypothetical protein